MTKRIATPEMKQALGKLIADGRMNCGLSRPAFIDNLSELSQSGLKNIECGKSWPLDLTARKLETALGWKSGSIDVLWERGVDGEDLSQVALDDVIDIWASSKIEPVRRASELPLDELLVELTHRVKGLEAELARQRIASEYMQV